jgi:hypothetical protein
MKIWGVISYFTRILHNFNAIRPAGGGKPSTNCAANERMGLAAGQRPERSRRAADAGDRFAALAMTPCHGEGAFFATEAIPQAVCRQVSGRVCTGIDAPIPHAQIRPGGESCNIFFTKPLSCKPTVAN